MSNSRESRSYKPNDRSSKSFHESGSSNRSRSPERSRSGRRCSSNTRSERNRSRSPRYSRSNNSELNAFKLPKRKPFDYNHPPDESPSGRGKTTNRLRSTSRESRSSERSRSGKRCSLSTRNERKRSQSPRHSRPNNSDSIAFKPQKRSPVDYDHRLDNSQTRRGKKTNRFRSTSRESRSSERSRSGRRCSSSKRNERKRSQSPRHSRPNNSELIAFKQQKRSTLDYDHRLDNSSTPRGKDEYGHDGRKCSIVNRRNQRDSDDSCKQGKDKIAEETSDPDFEKRADVYRRITTLQNGHTSYVDQTPEESLELDSGVSFSGGKTSAEVKRQTKSGYDCPCEPNTLRKASIKIEDKLSDIGFDDLKPLGAKLKDVYKSDRWYGTEEDKEVCKMFVSVRNNITHSRRYEPFVDLWHIHELEKRVIEIIEKKVK